MTSSDFVVWQCAAGAQGLGFKDGSRQNSTYSCRGKKALMQAVQFAAPSPCGAAKWLALAWKRAWRDEPQIGRAAGVLARRRDLASPKALRSLQPSFCHNISALNNATAKSPRAFVVHLSSACLPRLCLAQTLQISSIAASGASQLAISFVELRPSVLQTVSVSCGERCLRLNELASFNRFPRRSLLDTFLFLSPVIADERYDF